MWALMNNTVKCAGTLNSIPKGRLVEVIPATNLPDDSDFSHFAVDLSTGVEIAVYRSDITLLNQIGDKIFEVLKAKFGASTATTYHWLRIVKNQPASFCKSVMIMQVEALGFDYPGGLECTKYRKMRII